MPPQLSGLVNFHEVVGPRYQAKLRLDFGEPPQQALAEAAGLFLDEPVYRLGDALAAGRDGVSLLGLELSAHGCPHWSS